MWLLNTQNMELTYFVADELSPAPPYAILSHTWTKDPTQEEVTFDDMKSNIKGFMFETFKRMPSFSKKITSLRKIELCCSQAQRDGLAWAWVDTCCINKESSAELSEAINSMFRWYKESSTCYAYLADVSIANNVDLSESGFEQSRWFTRGWTLQELIAPRKLSFYDANWGLVGTKRALTYIITSITGVDGASLQSGDLSGVTVAQKMSWAAKRELSRVEDIAYCLLGIFDCNLPLLYGEGRKAFIRLQEEIIRSTDDASIFAWGEFQEPPIKVDAILPDCDSAFHSQLTSPLRGLLAESPKDFEHSILISWVNHELPLVNIDNVNFRRQPTRINLPLLDLSPPNSAKVRDQVDCGHNPKVAVIACGWAGHVDCYVGIQLLRWSDKTYGRLPSLIAIPTSMPRLATLESMAQMTKRIEISPEPVALLRKAKSPKRTTLSLRRIGRTLSEQVQSS